MGKNKHTREQEGVQESYTTPHVVGIPYLECFLLQVRVPVPLC